MSFWCPFLEPHHSHLGNLTRKVTDFCALIGEFRTTFFKLGLSDHFLPILEEWRMVTWHALLEWRRARSRRMEKTSSPPRVKNEDGENFLCEGFTAKPLFSPSFTTGGSSCLFCRGGRRAALWRQERGMPRTLDYAD